MISGRVSTYRGRRQLDHPEYQLLEGEELSEEEAQAYADQLIPVYPAVKGLDSARIAMGVKLALPWVDELPDPLPPQVRERQGLSGIGKALYGIHLPDTEQDVGRARKRLKWDEAFVLQLALAMRRHKAEALSAQPRPGSDDGILTAFDAQLPFTLTDGQEEVGERLAERLAGTS